MTDPQQVPNRDFIRVGRSRIQGRGLFAKRKIPRGTRIIEYTGERVPLERLLGEVGTDGNAAVYTFRLSPSVVIDGTRGGSEARFINHACTPNCEAYVFDDRVYLYAMRDIGRWEELTFDYRLRSALKGRRSRAARLAHPCHCDSPNCRGTLLAGRHSTRERS